MAAMAKSMGTSSFHWLEFVINRDKLLEHLKQDNPVPEPATLLVQFIENAEKYTAAIAHRLSNPPPPATTPAAEQARKVEDMARVMKVRTFKAMSLQLAAFMNWDLGQIATLPYGVQHALMRYASDYIDQNEFLFSVYHRWVLRSCQIPLKKPYQQDPLLDSLSRTLTPDDSLQALFQHLPLPHPSKPPPPTPVDEHHVIIVPTQLTFATNDPDFSVGAEIPLQTFQSILYLEIGIYLLYQGNAPAAAEHFKKSTLTEEFKYFKMPRHKLEGYHRAAGMIQTDPESPEDTSELKSVEFARLLRTGAMNKINRLVGASLLGFNGTGAPLPKEALALGVDPLNPDELDSVEAEGLFQLEKRLLEAQDPTVIKAVLVQLHQLNAQLAAAPNPAMKPVRPSYHTLFTHIKLPSPVKHTIDKLPPGPLQDYLFILAAKAKQLLGIKQFKDARTALEVTRFELNEQFSMLTAQERAAHVQAKTPFYYNVNKLLKILEWELIVVDLCELFENWTEIVGGATAGVGPGAAAQKKYVSELCQKCKEVVHTSFHLNKTNDVIPRRDVLETIVMALLNLGEYSFVIEQGLNQWSLLEFMSLVAKVCQDLVDRKDSSSNYRELWYAVLPIFSNSHSTATKSGKAGGVSTQKQAGLLASRTALMFLIDRAHSSLLVSLFVSILARFHNHIQDDVTLQIHSADFLHIWPNILDDVTTSSEMKSRASGSSKLNESQIFDVLIALLNRVCVQSSSGVGILGVGVAMPGPEAGWLKCIGDVYLAAAEPAQAMKAYLEFLAVGTDFFEKHSSPAWGDNALFRRMIKCCEQVQAFTQAMILCQFLTEVDYPLAFGMAQEKTTTDASDALYGFIWDMAILEFICNLHFKRNEMGKRSQVLKVMGLLELNGNNNEEIQREAMHLRKSQFMRTLAKLYIFV